MKASYNLGQNNRLHTEPSNTDKRHKARVLKRRFPKWGEGAVSAAKPSKSTKHETTLPHCMASSCTAVV